MSEPDMGAPAVAVVCESSDPRAARMEAYLRSRSLSDAPWFSPKDVDDVDDAVCAGQVSHVVFHDVSALFEAIWDREIRFETWLSRKIEISFCERPAPQTDTLHTVRRIYHGWNDWERRRRRRQTRAGAILSLLALAAAALIVATAN